MRSGGVVYLVGAGPGHPELITLRGVRALESADLVLYDALAHPDLLRLAATAEHVYVGKRAGRRSERQENIHRLMRAGYEQGKVVVRLKGGDPFLFGRGSEEAEFLADAEIPYQVVPGVPSPLAVSAYAGISVTHRALSSSVAFVTATESPEKDRSSHDWSRLATGPETLVIFMGLRKVRSLMKVLVDNGRAAETPAVVVQDASLGSQRSVEATVGTLADVVESEALGMPALIIVGHVARLRQKLNWYEHLPLFGKRVLVTRPVHQSSALATEIRDLGGVPFEHPTIRIVAPPDRAPIDRMLEQLTEQEFVVFTSANAVRAFFDILEEAELDARSLGGKQVTALGPKTAEALRAHGVRPDIMPTTFKGEETADAMLAAGAAGKRVLLPRALRAREVLPQRLRAAGCSVDVVPVYQTLPPTPEDAAAICALFDEGAVDLVTFTSSSTVTNLVGVVGVERLAGITLASIGPVTTRTAEALGLTVQITAETFTVRGLARALTRASGITHAFPD